MPSGRAVCGGIRGVDGPTNPGVTLDGTTSPSGAGPDVPAFGPDNCRNAVWMGRHGLTLMDDFGPAAELASVELAPLRGFSCTRSAVTGAFCGSGRCVGTGAAPIVVLNVPGAGTVWIAAGALVIVGVITTAVDVGVAG